MAEIFRKEVLHIEHGTHSWQDAIGVVGQIMLDVGSIEEGYIKAMIDAVEELGPYIVIAPHIAIPHAAARENVLKNDMVIAVFQQPVIFGTENDPVHLMIGLCALEPGSHLEQLTCLAGILDDENVWKDFLACKTVGQLYDFVNK